MAEDKKKETAVNLPFERVPQHECDPGFGPVPPRRILDKKASETPDIFNRHQMPEAELSRLGELGKKSGWKSK